MKKRSITSNYIYNLTYQLILILIPLLTTPYLTRVLGANKLGIYGYTYSIVTIFFIFSAVGINSYGQREIAYVQDDIEKRSKIFWELIIVRFISTTISILLLILFSCIIGKYSMYYKIFILYVISNFFDITWYYQGIEDFKSVSIRNIIVKTIYIISIFLFVKSSKDLNIYILLFSIFTIITNLSFWININKTIKKIELKKLSIKKHFKPVLILFVPQIASLIYTVLDKTMIGIIVPNISDVSFYEQASYIDKTILMVIITAGTVMSSRMAYAFKKDDQKLIKSYLDEIINFVWLLGCALSFGICAVIKNIVPWFYGNEYISVINLVYILSPIILVIGLNNVVGIQYLVPTNQQNKYVKAVICGSIINFLLNIVLINLIGTIGAAISSVIAEMTVLFIELKGLKNVISLRDIFGPSLKYIIFGIIMFIPTYFSGYIFGPVIYGTIFQTIIGMLIYISLLLITKDKFTTNHVLVFIKNKIGGFKWKKT